MASVTLSIIILIILAKRRMLPLKFISSATTNNNAILSTWPDVQFYVIYECATYRNDDRENMSSIQ